MNTRPGADEDQRQKGVVPRSLAAGVFLLFELPLVLPLILGWVAMTLFIRVRALTHHLDPGPDEGS